MGVDTVRAEIEGVTTHLAVSDDGNEDDPTFLFLHGNPDSGHLWDGVVSELSDLGRYVVPDLPGFGRSHPFGDFDCSLESMVRWVDGVLDAAEVDQPVHLIVHDFGGPYGLAWACRNEERVASVTAMDVPFFSEYHWHFWARVWRTPGLGELSARLMGRRLLGWEMRRGSRRLTKEQLDATWRFVHDDMKAMVLRLYRATDPEVFRGWEDELRGVLARVPSQALWGVHDPYIPPAWAERLGARQVHYFEDSGHWLPAEDPAGVAERLRGLVRQAEREAEAEALQAGQRARLRHPPPYRRPTQ